MIRWLKSLFNLNFLRTLLVGAAGAIPLLTLALGCTTMVDGVTAVCSGTWVKPEYAIYLPPILVLLNLFLKANQGGAFGTGLVAPTVPVVEKPQAGTVTAAQVASPKKRASTKP